MKKAKAFFIIVFLSFSIYSINMDKESPLFTIVQAKDANVTEDFSTATYRDSSSNVTGWGEDSLALPRQTPQIIGQKDLGAWGVTSLDVEGDLLYMVENTLSLVVCNISDPTEPTKYASKSISGLMDIKVEGQLIYASTFDNIQVYNSSDLPSFTYVDHYDTPNVVSETIIDGNYAYLSVANTGLYILDISDPSNLALVDTYSLTGITDICQDGELIFAASGTDDVTVLNVSNPSSVTFTTRYNLDGSVNHIDRFGNYLLATTNENKLQVLNITDTSSSTTLKTLLLPAAAAFLNIFGRFAYLGCDDQLIIVHLSNPANAQIVTEMTIFGTSDVNAIYVDRIYAFVAIDYKLLTTLEIATDDDLNANYIDRITTEATVRAVASDGTYAYIGDEDGYFYVVDTIDPENMQIVGSVDTGNAEFYDIKIKGNYAYLAGWAVGIISVNITDPTDPKFLDDASAGYACDLAIKNDIIFVAGSRLGLYVYNISNPFSLGYIDKYTYTDCSFKGIVLKGNLAYIADYNHGIVILNVTDPENIEKLSEAAIDSSSKGDLCVSGNYAYLPDYDNGITVFNITDNYNPTEVANLTTPGSVTYNIYLSGNRLFVADWNGGIQLINITNPLDPVIVDKLNAWGTSKVAFDGEYLFTGGSGGVFESYRVSRHYSVKYEPMAEAISLTTYSSSAYTITSATLSNTSTHPLLTYIDYYLSADDGANWQEFQPNIKSSFSHTGNKLKWKAVLQTSQDIVTPILDQISIDLEMKMNDSPTLLSPADLSKVNSGDLTFTWSSVSEAIFYEIQIDSVITFDSVNFTEYNTSYTNYNTSLPDGEWYWRVFAYDSDEFPSDSSSIYSFSIDSLDPSIDEPVDIVCSEGSCDEYITWLASDAHPDSYSVTRNGTEIDSDSNWDGSPIIIHILDYAFGTYIFECNVNDEYGNSNSDIVQLNVIDTTHPTIDSPSNITADEGEEILITWTPSDLNPHRYNISVDDDSPVSYIWDGGTIEFLSSSLDVGNHTVTCTVIDKSGNSVSDEVGVEILDCTLPLIDNPEDLSYQIGISSHNLTWIVSDEFPNYYEIWKNETMIVHEIWTENTIILYLDTFGIGIYNFTCFVCDCEMNNNSDSVIVIILPNVPPELSQPEDFSYEIFTVNNTIDWYPSDLDPYNYVIYHNGSVWSTDFWEDSVTISIDIDGLSMGVHNFTCELFDAYGNSVTDTVIVIVTENYPPTINHPNDKYVEYGSIGNTLSWSPIANDPLKYEITRNGTIVKSGTWFGTTLNVSLDGLEIDLYLFNCTVWDIANNTVSDIVQITVRDTLAPQIIGSGDLSITEGDLGYNITWDITDASSFIYSIQRNSEVYIDFEETESGVFVSLDNLESGTYVYNITAEDIWSNSAQDSITITVLKKRFLDTLAGKATLYGSAGIVTVGTITGGYLRIRKKRKGLKTKKNKKTKK